MKFSNQEIGICLIAILLLISINYFRQAVFRYNLIVFYLIFAIYVYINIDKRYSLGILVLFIFNYMFIAKKPIMEHFEEGTDDTEPQENPQLMAIDEDVENQELEQEQEEEVDEEEIEKGVEQFKTEDKFTKLHDLLHTMSEQIKTANNKQKK